MARRKPRKAIGAGVSAPTERVTLETIEDAEIAKSAEAEGAPGESEEEPEFTPKRTKETAPPADFAATPERRCAVCNAAGAGQTCSNCGEASWL
jgi:hypothetical protein